jgi:SAM-dependent methyltransferase
MTGEADRFNSTGPSWAERAGLGGLRAVIGPNSSDRENSFLHGIQMYAARRTDRRIPDHGSLVDFGCGNGRFYAELERRGLVREYLGVDTSPPLLELARASHPKARFVEADATALVPEPRFDLVVAFGLLHHLPSFELREKLVASLREHLVEGGLACLTFWRFAERERFLDRMVPFDDGLEVEPGDYLIEFAGEGARYCHHSSEVEVGELLAATGMTEIDRYSADGESGDLNLYSVLVRS